MKRKRKLISFLCCIAAIGIFVGIYSAGRVQSPFFAAVCGISFAASALALILSILMYIRYYKDNY